MTAVALLDCRKLTFVRPLQTVLSTLHTASLTSVCAFVDSAYSSPEPSLFSALAAKTPLPTGLVIGTPSLSPAASPRCARDAC